jgi:hypothetical protein
LVDEALIQRWSSRGRAPQMSTTDAFLMMLLYVRNYPSYIELARAFGCKESTALDTVSRVLGAIHEPLSASLVVPLSKQEQLATGKESN